MWVDVYGARPTHRYAVYSRGKSRGYSSTAAAAACAAIDYGIIDYGFIQRYRDQMVGTAVRAHNYKCYAYGGFRFSKSKWR